MQFLSDSPPDIASTFLIARLTGRRFVARTFMSGRSSVRRGPPGDGRPGDIHAATPEGGLVTPTRRFINVSILPRFSSLAKRLLAGGCSRQGRTSAEHPFDALRVTASEN